MVLLKNKTSRLPRDPGPRDCLKWIQQLQKSIPSAWIIKLKKARTNLDINLGLHYSSQNYKKARMISLTKLDS